MKKKLYIKILWNFVIIPFKEKINKNINNEINNFFENKKDLNLFKKYMEQQWIKFFKIILLN